MVDDLKRTAEKNGDRLQVVPIRYLKNLKDEIMQFQQEQELNGFQKWIVNDLYSYAVPEHDSPIASIILVAMPHPAYANVLFAHGGREYPVYGLVASDREKTEQYISQTLERGGYTMLPAGALPLKRLAVQCGLAEYGRNNITYVQGMGSHFSYAAFFTDLPCDDAPWREVCTAQRCQGCMACINHCPTGAIRQDRFLIDNTRCLSAMNEGGGEFPQWLPFSVHHTVYDCLRCQINCPMNQEANENIAGPVRFEEWETQRVLQGPPYDDVPPVLQQKVRQLELNKWGEGVSRNLTVLFDLMDKGHVPSLK